MQLREARRRLGADLTYCVAGILASHVQPAAADVGHLHEVLQTMREIERDEASGALLALRAPTSEVLDQARKLLAALDLTLALLCELEESDMERAFSLRDKCHRLQFPTGRASLEALFTEIDALLQAQAEFMQKPVTGIPAPTGARPTRAQDFGHRYEII
jgi:hypothetical protein